MGILDLDNTRNIDHVLKPLEHEKVDYHTLLKCISLEYIFYNALEYKYLLHVQSR